MISMDYDYENKVVESVDTRKVNTTVLKDQYHTDLDNEITNRDLSLEKECIYTYLEKECIYTFFFISNFDQAPVLKVA